VFTKAADRRRHLALKRLPPHLPIGHDFQADTFLQRNGVIDGTIFDQFEFSSGDGSSGELLLSRNQLRRPKQAADDVSMSANRNLLCSDYNLPLMLDRKRSTQVRPVPH
jgi:hypothetical protein